MTYPTPRLGRGWLVALPPLVLLVLVAACSGSRLPTTDIRTDTDSAHNGNNEAPIMNIFPPQTTYVVGVQQDVRLRASDKEDSQNIRFKLNQSSLAALASRSQIIFQGAKDGVATAIFRWTAEAGDLGKHGIKFRAWDPHGNTGAANLYLTVVAK